MKLPLNYLNFFRFFQPKSLCESLVRFKQLEGETLVKEQMVTNDLKLIDGMSAENVRKLKGKKN